MIQKREHVSHTKKKPQYQRQINQEYPHQQAIHTNTSHLCSQHLNTQLPTALTTQASPLIPSHNSVSLAASQLSNNNSTMIHGSLINGHLNAQVNVTEAVHSSQPLYSNTSQWNFYSQSQHFQ